MRLRAICLDRDQDDVGAIVSMPAERVEVCGEDALPQLLYDSNISMTFEQEGRAARRRRLCCMSGLMLAEVHQASRAKLAMELKRILASP